MKKVVLLTGVMLVICAQTVCAQLTWSGCDVSEKAFMRELALGYEQETGIKITLSAVGVAQGIREVNEGKASMGGSCRHLMPEEENNASLVIVAWDALVVIVNKDNPVTTISHTALQEVLTGKITKWKQLGGPDHPIDFFDREGTASGVGIMARELIFGDADIDFIAAKSLKSSGPVEEAIEQSPWSLAITGVSSARKRGVKILRLNGVEPSTENILQGHYILGRPLYIVTPKNRSDELNKFLWYAKSPKGQKIIEEQGVIPASKSGDMLRRYRLLMQNVKGSKKGAFEEVM